MADIPLGDFDEYVGIDPGFQGGICGITSGGELFMCRDMPTIGEGKKRTYDLDTLWKITQFLHDRPGQVLVGLEWPNTRPGEGAERSARFGMGKAYLHSMLHFSQTKYALLAPNLWKGRLGLPGKHDKTAAQQGLALLETVYGGGRGRYTGDRGGIKDGRVDAACIAHFLRGRNLRSVRSTVERHGKNSDAAWAMLGRAGSRRKKGKSGGLVF